MQKQKMTRMTRRRAMQVTAGAIGAAALPLVHMRTSRAAGSLKMGIWDHWVKATNPVMRGLVEEWAKKNKVEVQLDFGPPPRLVERLRAAVRIGQPLEEGVRPAEPAGQDVDPGAVGEPGAVDPVEGAEPQLVGLVEQGALEVRGHGSSVTP